MAAEEEYDFIPQFEAQAQHLTQVFQLPVFRYQEMILTAIEELNEKSGLNKTSILKHIESTNRFLPPAYHTLLMHYLKRMISSGQLVFFRNNYLKLDPSSPPRRGRGRPLKPKSPLPPGAVLPPPRPRGRPPKSHDPTNPLPPPKPKPASATTSVSGRKHGRPPKASAEKVPSDTLPQYQEMVLTTIEELNEKSGSNKTSILKHIESTHRFLPPVSPTLLMHYLKKMISSGQLVFFRNNYLKFDPSSPPHRGRGRPPKPKSPLPPGAVLPPPRPRGRPPKSHDPTDPLPPPKPNPASATTSVSGRKRGRPPKASAEKVPSDTLPQYQEMILTAIEELNEKSGSNKTSILKHIESTHRFLPPLFPTLLMHYLKRMISSGQLVFFRNNYLKFDPSSPPRRGRGRPRKPKSPLPPGAVLPPPRPRGRPPKSHDPTDPLPPPKPKPASATTSVSGRKRGRPPKASAEKVPSDTLAPSATGGVPRGRGRPPKVKPTVAATLGA